MMYSSNQTVEMSNGLEPDGQALNLDGVAVMVPQPAWDRERVVMVLRKSLSLGIERLVGKLAAGEKYVFNRFTSHVHIVRAGKREFRVMLQSVRDKSSETENRIAYTFGISEQGLKRLTS